MQLERIRIDSVDAVKLRQSNAKGAATATKRSTVVSKKSEGMHKKTINTTMSVKDSATCPRRGDRNEKEVAGCEMEARGTSQGL